MVSVGEMVTVGVFVSVSVNVCVYSCVVSDTSVGFGVNTEPQAESAMDNAISVERIVKLFLFIEYVIRNVSPQLGRIINTLMVLPYPMVRVSMNGRLFNTLFIILKDHRDNLYRYCRVG
jgi:hypothetical protein